MRIKEVENLTGLTAKAIRLYESKGLLDVARESENDYREYTEADVQRLKNIALLRKLDVPVKTIKEWTDGKTSLLEILKQASTQNQEASRESELRHKLSAELAELLEKDPNLDVTEVVADLDELNGLLTELEEALSEDSKHIWLPLWHTLISLGPVLGTVLCILEGQTTRALIGLVLSVAAIAWCTIQWQAYLKTPKAERKHDGCLKAVLEIVFVLVFMFALLVGIQNLQNELFMRSPTDVILQRSLMLTVAFIAEVTMGLLYLRKKPWQEKQWKRGSVVAVSAIVIAANMLLLYGCIINVSIADEQGVTRYSMLHPEGELVPYSEVELIETGFKGTWLGLPVRGTGDFYYKVTYSDGTTENWGDSTSQAEEETWMHMLRLDAWFLSGGAEKEGSEENWEYCAMDQFYVDILREVIGNR